MSPTKTTLFRPTLLLFSLVLSMLSLDSLAQENDSTDQELSKFDQFNKKAENLFTYIPVPFYSYSTEAGHVFGAAKYNLFDLNKKDTISQPSKMAELVTFSSEGRVKVSISTDLIWHENKYMVLGFIAYNKQREYVLGVGNDVTLDSLTDYEYTRFHFVNTGYVALRENMYVGLGFDISDYTSFTYDTNSVLNSDYIIGNETNTTFGIKLAFLSDQRDNRYNAYKGYYFRADYTFHPGFLSNPYIYQIFTIDARKYYNIWKNHVIAGQVTSTYCNGEVPFYDLAKLGGDSQMRGYYEGALRDNILVDAQVEYRMPIWNIFGITTWLGTGRVANDLEDLSFQDFWWSYGLGLRIMVDSKNQTNLRFDFGFGQEGVKGFYVNFSEAF